MGDQVYQVWSETGNTGKKVRYRERTVGANTVEEPYLIRRGSSRVPSYIGSASTFRKVGNASETFAGIGYIGNADTSTVIVNVREITVGLDMTAALATVALQFNVLPLNTQTTSDPASGTALTKAPFDTALSSNSAVRVFGSAASDGGSGPVIGVTGSLLFYVSERFAWRPHTVIGQLTPPAHTVHLIDPAESWHLAAGDGLLVQVVATSAIPATTHMLVNMVWEEYTTP